LSRSCASSFSPRARPPQGRTVLGILGILAAMRGCGWLRVPAGGRGFAASLAAACANAKWGDGVVVQLAATLGRLYPGIRRFTRRNLFE
jgi:hypothetical protein